MFKYALTYGAGAVIMVGMFFAIAWAMAIGCVALGGSPATCGL